MLDRTLGLREADPELVAARDERIARAKREMAERVSGVKRQETGAMFDRRIAQLEEDNWGPVDKGVRRLGIEIWKRLVPDEWSMAAWGGEAEKQRFEEVAYATEHNVFMPEAYEKLGQAADKMSEAADKMNEASDRQPRPRLLVGPDEDR